MTLCKGNTTQMKLVKIDKKLKMDFKFTVITEEILKMESHYQRFSLTHLITEWINLLSQLKIILCWQQWCKEKGNLCWPRTMTNRDQLKFLKILLNKTWLKKTLQELLKLLFLTLKQLLMILKVFYSKEMISNNEENFIKKQEKNTKD